MRTRISKIVKINVGVQINSKCVVKEAPFTQIITNNVRSIKRLNYITLEQFYQDVQLVYNMRRTKLKLENNGAFDRFNYALNL